MKYYSLEVANTKRDLPIIEISEKLSIASFVILGDTELVVKASLELAKKLPKVDYLVTAEAKGIPLVQELSRILNLDRYIVARKSIKAYMENPVIHKVNSITTSEEQMLCLDEVDGNLIKGKNVALIDDVISTGKSLEALEKLVTSLGGKILAKAAILAEGDASQREDIIFLESLPIFPK